MRMVGDSSKRGWVEWELGGTRVRAMDRDRPGCIMLVSLVWLSSSGVGWREVRRGMGGEGGEEGGEGRRDGGDRCSSIDRTHG